MNETDETARRAALKGGEIGVHLVVCVLVGVGLGFLADRWLGWQPWGMVAGCFLGFAAWLNMVMRMKA